METKTEQQLQVALEQRQPAPLVVQNPAPMTPMDMVARMVDRGASIEELQKMMDFAERIEKRDAEKSFVGAMAEFKHNPPRIEKNRRANVSSKKGEGASYAYLYANLADVCAAVVHGLAAVGISHKWQTKQQDGHVAVTCTLTHERGHSESTMLSAGLDLSGGKNNLQALGSTVSYLERYTLLAATGLAVDDGQDDDGEAGITQAERQELRGAASDMRRNASPAAAAEKRQGKQAPPPSQLLQRAQTAADQGRDAFGKFWAALQPAERGTLRHDVPDLETRVKNADKRAGAGSFERTLDDGVAELEQLHQGGK